MARGRPPEQTGSGAGSPELVEVTMLSERDRPARARRPRARRAALALALLAALVGVRALGSGRAPPVSSRGTAAARPPARAPDADPLRCLGITCLPPGLVLAGRASSPRPAVFGDADR